MTDKVVLFSTCPNMAEAEKLAGHLVEARLAACVNAVPAIRSFYRWKGKIENEPEVLLVIKTARDRVAAVRAEIEKLHSYELPELIALPVVDGAPNYLAWLDSELEPQAGVEPAE
jgi:periplasmic divalent cation tolerance protein